MFFFYGRSTHGLEAPLSDDQGRLLVSNDYIAFCLAKAKKIYNIDYSPKTDASQKLPANGGFSGIIADWRWPLSCVRSVIWVFSAQLSECWA